MAKKMSAEERKAKAQALRDIMEECGMLMDDIGEANYKAEDLQDLATCRECGF